MLNGGVVEINRQGKFSVEEANGILPLIHKITEEYSQLVNELENRLEALGTSDEKKAEEIEQQVNEYVQQWHSKVRKLGGLPKGLWLVDFDSGDGYFCWKYPEAEISHWHSYDDGFLGRVTLKERESKDENCARTDQLNPW